jgi:hypothetical protein
MMGLDGDIKGAYGKTLTKICFMISTKPALSEIGFGVC